MIEEVWKDIKGYEGMYQVSNTGKIKSLKRIDCAGKIRTGNILQPNKLKKGYLRIGLNKNGIRERFMVHRLVAEAFIPNPENKPFIDHINTIKDDNRVENLRWVTNQENCNNPITLEKYSNCRKGLDNYSSIPILQFTLNGKLKALFINSKDAENKTGINDTCIRNCYNNIRGRKTAGGYKWCKLYDYLGDILEEIQNEDIINERVA